MRVRADTHKRMAAGDLRELYQSGFRHGLWHPQYHGRSHFDVQARHRLPVPLSDTHMQTYISTLALDDQARHRLPLPLSDTHMQTYISTLAFDAQARHHLPLRVSAMHVQTHRSRALTTATDTGSLGDTYTYMLIYTHTLTYIAEH